MTTRWLSFRIRVQIPINEIGKGFLVLSEEQTWWWTSRKGPSLFIITHFADIGRRECAPLYSSSNPSIWETKLRNVVLRLLQRCKQGKIKRGSEIIQLINSECSHAISHFVIQKWSSCQVLITLLRWISFRNVNRIYHQLFPAYRNSWAPHPSAINSPELKAFF